MHHILLTGTEAQKTSQLNVIWRMFELFFFITFGLSNERACGLLVLSNKIISERKCQRYFFVGRTPISTLGVYIKISTNCIKSNVKVKLSQSLTKGEGRYS
jgi:hypothetical protein